jgi:hypothetical protein
LTARKTPYKKPTDHLIEQPMIPFRRPTINTHLPRIVGLFKNDFYPEFPILDAVFPNFLFLVRHLVCEF